MRGVLAGLAILAVAPALALADEVDQGETSYEEQIVQCMYEADPDLLYAMRDADSPEAMMEAFAKGAALCEADMEYDYSMKLFFDAVNERIGPPEYADEMASSQGDNAS